MSDAPDPKRKLPLGVVAAEALLRATLERLPELPVSRANLLAFPDGGGCLVIVWGEGAVERDPAVVDHVDGKPVKGACPKCKATQVLGKADGDGDLVCSVCGHNWHDAAFDDAAPTAQPS